MASFIVRLEFRDAKSHKFWEAEVVGKTQTIRFGKLGTQGQTLSKDFADADEALVATKKVADEKRKKGYADPSKSAPASATPAAAKTRRTTGGLFVKATAELTANAIAAKLRGEGKLSKTDARKPDDLGDNGVVGVAVHPPKNGFFAVVDSADGAQGIGDGDGCNVAILANHAGTDVIWYRFYSSDLAVGVRFNRGSSGFLVEAGTEDVVRAWLDAQGVPLGSAVPPKDAGEDALLFSVKYEAETYRRGPDEAATKALAGVADALVVGGAEAVRSRFDELDANAKALALGIMRGEKRGNAEACVAELAKRVGKSDVREAPKQESFAEVVLARAVLSASDDVRGRLITELDRIEVEAESRSNWAQPTGLWGVGAALTNAGQHAMAYLAWSALARRKEPRWDHANLALSSLTNSTAGALVLTAMDTATLEACEARLPELGLSAQDAILYNLACVYARANEKDKALDRLSKCSAIRKQNPHPETDTDLRSLWDDPTFRDILDGKVAGGPPMSLDEMELSVRTSALLAERGAKSVADVLKLDPTTLPKAAVAELREFFEENDVAWGAASSEDEGDADDYQVPAERRVPRIEIELKEGGDGKALTNRIGGLPRAPSKTSPWPESAARPMQLIAQLVGKAGGGELDLADITVVQIFADMEGAYFKENRVVVYRVPCPAVLKAPVGCEAIAVQTMTLTPSFDDRIVLEEDFDGDDDHEDAYSAAYCDKVFGLSVGGNLDPELRDSQGMKMRPLLQLVGFDEWFVWALFSNEDMSEMKLQVVRT